MIERLQSQALKSIFGWKIPYADLRRMAGVSTLRQRRILMADKFAEAAAVSPRFRRWFPRRRAARAASRVGDKYVETFARCDRLRNSPIHYMRRRLNGKEGMRYGERNRQYRDTEEDGITLRRRARV